MQPTLRNIASTAGVNVSTVSRALHGHHSIPVATRQTILAVAGRLGWKANPFASAYMAHLGRTKTTAFKAVIAFIICLDRKNPFPDYHRKVLEGAGARASEAGYKVQSFWLQDYEFDIIKLQRVLKSRGIHGVIFHPYDQPESVFEKLDWGAFTFAGWGQPAKRFPLHYACFHYQRGLRLMIERLRAMKYKRMAMILEEQTDLFDHAVYSEFLHAEKHRLAREWIDHFALPPGVPAPEWKTRTMAWIKSHKPEVIIGNEFVWETLKAMKWKVGERVAFASLCWSETWPQVGGVDQLPSVIGANAVDLILTQFLQNERGIPAIPRFVLNEGRWRDGPSVPGRQPVPSAIDRALKNTAECGGGFGCMRPIIA